MVLYNKPAVRLGGKLMPTTRRQSIFRNRLCTVFWRETHSAQPSLSPPYQAFFDLQERHLTGNLINGMMHMMSMVKNNQSHH
ncbi:hypothetical protein CC2G_002312 [Coprinopsis cinerea AmutBmut pab1-1]|nr:hypothetical protein CC2G_002312 [Coprinopsis cinerea AmutBmut pab1-1]